MKILAIKWKMKEVFPALKLISLDTREKLCWKLPGKQKYELVGRVPLI